MGGNHALEGTNVQKELQCLIAIFMYQKTQVKKLLKHMLYYSLNLPATEKPLTRACASWPAPMNPTLMMPENTKKIKPRMAF